MEPRRCIICNAEFSPRRPTQICCSHPCMRTNWNRTHRDNRKQYYQQNMAKEKAQMKAWRTENIEHKHQQNKKWYDRVKGTEKYITQRKTNLKTLKEKNPSYKIGCYIQNSMYYAVKKGKRLKSATDLLGCPIDEYKIYLEKQFRDGMSWENYGTVWDIDHCKPLSLFDLTKTEEQKKCFHYTNTQPLLKKENGQKYNLYDDQK